MGVFQPRRRASATPRPNNTQPPTSTTAAPRSQQPPTLPSNNAPLVWIPSPKHTPAPKQLAPPPPQNISPALQIPRSVPVPQSIPKPQPTQPIQPNQHAPPHIRHPTDPQPDNTTDPARKPEPDPSPYPVDILDSIDRVTADNRLSRQDPALRVLTLLSFLMRNRTPVATSFSIDCLNWYNTKYSRKMREIKTFFDEGQSRSQSTNPDSGGQPRQTATPSPGAVAHTRNVASVHSNKPSEVIVIPDDLQQAIPVVEIEDPPLSPPKEPLPKVSSRMYSGRDALASAVQNRWDRLRMELESTPSRRCEDGDNYVIWKGRDNAIRLSFDFCRPLNILHDKDKRISDVHLDALRFLWQFMIEDPCAGAVLNAAIGYPRTQVVLTFCFLVLTTFVKTPKSIVIFCPPCAAEEWRVAADNCRGVSVLVLHPDTWTRDLDRAKTFGGVLICPFDTYLRILTAPDSQKEKRIQATRLLCRPGPALAILDEASRLRTLQPVLRRALSRTKTKARLALTSLPCARNMVRFWSIIDWAIPEFLGTLEEYSYIFVRNIISQSRDIAPGNRHDWNGSLVEAELQRLLRQVVFPVCGKRLNECLRQKGHYMSETTIFLKLSHEHQQLYNDVADFVRNARERGDLSEYVAMHVLLLASTSILALLQLLRNEWREEMEANKMARSSSCVAGLFRELRGVIQRRIKDSISYTKIEAVLTLCDHVTKSHGKLVLFSAMMEVGEELASAIKTHISECKLLICSKFTSFAERRAVIRKFNACCSEGVVLLAPIGLALDCVEDAGWGAIRASHVLFTDCSWNDSTISQGVNRVYNFTSGAKVAVYHLVTVNTVEYDIHARVVRRHAPSFLLPRICNSSYESRAPSIESASSDKSDECTRRIAMLQGFHHAEQSPSRSELTSDACIFTPRADAHQASLMVARQRVEYFRSLPAVIDAVQELSYGTNLYETLRNTRAYLAYSAFPSKSDQTSSSFISYWRDYFRLYEQSLEVDDITHTLEVQEISGRVSRTPRANGSSSAMIVRQRSDDRFGTPRKRQRSDVPPDDHRFRAVKRHARGA